MISQSLSTAKVKLQRGFGGIGHPTRPSSPSRQKQNNDHDSILKATLNVFTL